jgi:hypothetical protein
MATIRKLTSEEIEQLMRGTQKKGSAGISERVRIAQEYDMFLADFAPSDYGEVDLAEGENKLTVRSRLSAAAKRRGWKLIFTPTRGQAIRFHVDNVV